MADFEALRQKWRKVLQSSDDVAVQARAHQVLEQLARHDENPEMQKHVAAYDRIRGETEDLRSEPDPTSTSELVGAAGHDLGERVKGLGRAAAQLTPLELPGLVLDSSKRHEFERGVDDAVTLGYGNKLARKVSSAVTGMTPADFAKMEQGERQAAPDVRASGNLFGAFLPSPVNYLGGKATQGLTKLIPHSSSVLGESIRSAGRGLGTYEATAPLVAAGHADSGDARSRLKAAGQAMTDPAGMALAAGMGGLAGGAEELLGGAPKRKEESEIAGLREEGVQYSTKIRKFKPNEADMRAELNQDPEIRAAVKSDPVKAQKLIDAKVNEVVDTDLAPFYEGLVKTGRDKVPIELVRKNLEGVASDFHPGSEEAQVAFVKRQLEHYEDVAVKNGGFVPVDYLRKGATSMQKQGWASTPMFGSVPLAKAARQDIGRALRDSISDHIETLADDPAAGKGLREAYEKANRRVAVWSRMQEIIDEKAARVETKSPPMGEMVKEGVHAAKHPLMFAASKLAGPAADVMDRRVLGPLVASPVGEVLAPVGRRLGVGARRVSTLPAFMPEIEQAYADYLARQQQENQQ